MNLRAREITNVGEHATKRSHQRSESRTKMLSGAINGVWPLLKDAFQAWLNGKTPRLGAALAYYTIFAIAPLFIIALTIAGFWFGEEAARKELFGQISSLVGKEGGEAIQSIIAAAGKKTDAGLWAGVAAVTTLFVGATGVFVELQDALNTIWNVKRDASRGWKGFIRDRLLSFGMVVGIGFLLLVSLVLSAALAALGSYVGGLVSVGHLVSQTANFMLSLAIITFLFAMIFKFLPDVRIAWRDVWMGSFITALLFNFGKFLLGFYLGRESVSSAYGAAGSLVIVLVWVFYSTQILFFGAEFTRAFANRYGSALQPTKGAHFITVQEIKAQRAARKHHS
jgi:membrane protein